MSHSFETHMDQRKADHIALTDQSQLAAHQRDGRFDYEPLFAAHPSADEWQRPTAFLGKTLRAPLWISSMTGGTEHAFKINSNLARVAREFGLGFALGSCRPLLEGNERLKDFDWRATLGDEVPFFANLGIAQIENLIARNQLQKVHAMVETLKADGLIIHINPLQEWFQPEGDRFTKPPLETIETFLASAPYKVIVKEVGQGMGPKSLLALMKLPLAAIEFGAFGGTNFSTLERLRGESAGNYSIHDLERVGHTASEMLTSVNHFSEAYGAKIRCQSIIISGGVRGSVMAHELLSKARMPAVIAMAKPFLDHAQGDYESLRAFVHKELLELEMAKRFLTLREE